MEGVVEPVIAPGQPAGGEEQGDAESPVEHQRSEADVVNEDSGTLEEAGYGYGV